MAEENPGVGSGILGMFNAFVDPAGLAKAAKAKLFWLWPLIVFLIVFIVVGYLMLPYTTQLMDAKLAERSMPPEQLENIKATMHKFAPVGVFINPIVIVLIIMLCAWLVSVVGSMLGVRAKFRDVFSISMACSLIGCLQYIAGYIVVRIKGDEIVNQDQLTPAFGLDIFIPAHGVSLAILNFFSIFQIWSLVIFALAVACLAGVSKGKAFAAITPAWVVPLIVRVVIAALSGGGSSS
jgi:hypothetical protein